MPRPSSVSMSPSTPIAQRNSITAPVPVDVSIDKIIKTIFLIVAIVIEYFKKIQIFYKNKKTLPRELNSISAIM